MEPIIDALAYVASLALGLVVIWGLIRGASNRWVRPPEEPGPIDPESAMQTLLDEIAKSPARSRGAIITGGLRVHAYWVTDIEVRSGTGAWSSGYWVLVVGATRCKVANIDQLWTTGLEMLHAIKAVREAAAADEADDSPRAA